MRPRAPDILLLAFAILPACASDRGLPPDPPPDFLLVVEGRDATDPPCDFSLALAADGTLRYDVRHRGEKPTDRRGAFETDPAAARAVWDALLASGILSKREFRLAEVDGRGGGRVAYSLTAGGRTKRVVVDGGSDPELDAVLQALLAAAPPRLLLPPGGE